MIRSALFVSHTSIYETFRVGSHHLAREFARAGIDVTHMSTPHSLIHSALRRGESARATAAKRGRTRDADGVEHYVPRTVLPAGLPPRFIAPTDRRQRFDVILIDQPTLWSKKLRDLTDLLVYRPTDQYFSGLKHRLQAALVGQADAVIATSHEVALGLGHTQLPTLVLENGVEYHRFVPSPCTDLVAVYVGAVDSRFDAAAVDILATHFPQWTFILAGGRGVVSSHENVKSIGSIPYDDLPALLSRARVGLLPLSASPENAGRSPMKLYEYLASGLYVVATETPTIRPGLAPGVFTYRDPRDVVGAFRDASDEQGTNCEGREVARTMSWEFKARIAIDFLESIAR